MESPFNKSSLTRRSPPPTPVRDRDEPAATPPAAPPETASTQKIQTFADTIHAYLNQICSISTEGKLNTEQKLKISNSCRSVMHGVTSMVVHYQSISQELTSAQSAITALNKEKDICAQLEELKNGFQTAAAEIPTHSCVSFSDALKKGKNQFICPPSSANLTIYPVDKAGTSEQTKKIVQEIIKPDKLKLHIRGVRKIRNGGLIISTAGKEDLEKIKTSVQLQSSGLKLEEPNKRRPRIILLGVPSDISDQNLFDCIYEQNIIDKHPDFAHDKYLSSIRFSHKSGKKDSSVCNYILEVTAELRKMLIHQERIFVNWTSCPVRDYTLVTRCYKCQQYGHSAKYCRDSEPTCGHCGSIGHTLKDCAARDKPESCASCKRFNKPSAHKTGDVQCPARKIAEERHLQSIDYIGG